MSEELLRCPHCDSDSLEVYRFMQVARTDQRYVWCRCCDAHGPIGNGAAHAVELWNWRRAARAPGPDVSRLMAAAESMDIRHRADGTWIASLLSDPCIWTIKPTLAEAIAAVAEREAAGPAATADSSPNTDQRGDTCINANC